MATFCIREIDHHISTRSAPHKIEWVFTRGHCHSLAIAIHQLTGFPLVGLFNAKCASPHIAEHVVVKTPDGKLLDVRGTNVAKQWAHCTAHVIQLSDIDEWVGEWDRGNLGYRTPAVEEAKAFARATLKKFGY